MKKFIKNLLNIIQDVSKVVVGVGFVMISISGLYGVEFSGSTWTIVGIAFFVAWFIGMIVDDES